MEGVIMEYHLWFMTIAIAFFLLEIMILFFSEHTIQKLIGCVILSGFNMNICWIAAFSFLGVNILGFDTGGNLVNNPTADMYMFFAIFLALFFVNIGFMIYTHVSLLKVSTKLKEQKKKANAI